MASELLPRFITPEALADHFGVSERTIRDLARELGACSTIGKKMILLEGHVDLILEATRSCRSQSTKGAKSGTTEEVLPEGDYEALRALRTKKPRNGSRLKKKQKPGNVISMDRGRI